MDINIFDEEYPLSTNWSSAADLVLLEERQRHQIFKSLYQKEIYPNISHEARLCGSPVYCTWQTNFDCWNITTRQCWACSSTNLGLLLFAFFFFGFMILFGNMLVFYSIYSKDKNQRTKFEHIKASLAVSDILSGIGIITVAIPSVFWTLDHSVKQLLMKSRLEENTLRAKVTAYFSHYFSICSTYQLLMIVVLRFYAIVRPLQNRTVSYQRCKWMIFAVWLGAACLTSIPFWFPRVFTIIYEQNQFMYSLKSRSSNTNMVYIAILGCILMLPYLVMFVVTAITWLYVLKKLRRSKKLSNQTDKLMKREKAVTKTIMWMEVGFASTTLPFVTIIILLESDVIDCIDLPLPYFMAFYIFYYGRSFVNVIAYLISEKKFRRFMMKIFFNKIYSDVSTTQT